ncbi:MAG: hypothetical protein GF313_08055 [Caldithrix sp.]|nr:hypothetical protein [Caldithrix sp.]
MNTEIRNELSGIKADLYTFIKEKEHQALAYLLNFEAGERRLSYEVKKDLQKRFGKEILSPQLRWKSRFEYIGPEYESILDDLISEFLKDKGYNEDPYLIPRDRLKNYIWKKSRQQAHAILNELTQREV